MVAELRTGEIERGALWRSGHLGRFCFISTGVMLHATNETMLATIMPSLVRDLSGIEMIGWSLSIYELGAITAGAAAGRMISYISLRKTMVLAALLYAMGAAICALSPSMPLFLLGRVIEGLGGGGLMGVAFVSVERLFPSAIWPQLFAIISVVWGISAFSGPLLGALFVEHFNWRAAFTLFAAAGIVMAGASQLLLHGAALRIGVVGEDKPPPFPFAPLSALAFGVIMVASAGVVRDMFGAIALFTLGIFGLVLFFRLDGRNPRSRLFPSNLFDWRHPLGAGMIMVGALSIATCSFFIYGPILLTTLHGIPVLTAGYIIAAESIAWSVLSIAVANLRAENERLVIVSGAVMITTGIAGFAYAVPAGSIFLILVCALLQGGGFGIAWPFVTRMIVSAAPEHERTVASSGVSALQRIGYATGAALCGIVANDAGFSDGLNAGTSAEAAPWLFLAFLPLAAIGVAASMKLVRHAAPAAP